MKCHYKNIIFLSPDADLKAALENDSKDLHADIETLQILSALPSWIVPSLHSSKIDLQDSREFYGLIAQSLRKKLLATGP